MKSIKIENPRTIVAEKLQSFLDCYIALKNKWQQQLSLYIYKYILTTTTVGKEDEQGE